MTRLDLSLYLLLIVTVVVVCFNLVASGLVLTGLTHPENEFLSFLPAGSTRNIASLAFGLGPLVMFMYVYQRYAYSGFRFWQVPVAGFVFTLYTYVWILATVRALGRSMLRRRNWAKTPRVVDPIGSTAELSSSGT